MLSIYRFTEYQRCATRLEVSRVAGYGRSQTMSPPNLHACMFAKHPIGVFVLRDSVPLRPKDELTRAISSNLK
jgi:hypothetical protein